MTGFFKDGRADDAPLSAEELATMKKASELFYALAILCARAKTIADCRVIDQKATELQEAL